MDVTDKAKETTLDELQQLVDEWIHTYGVRYFDPLTNMAILTEETGEVARVMARLYGEQSAKASDHLDLADELARGQRRAQRDAALTIALWRKVVETLPPLENRSLRDTLRSIGRGFRCYDTRFFPQRFDCDIDYQLSQSVSESLLGINYVNQYLARLAAENSLLTRLPQGEVRAVLERSCPDWRGLLVNLYAPAAANVLARTLLGGEGLTLSDGEIGALRERWEHVRPERIENDLLTAADALAERLALPRGAGKYLSSCAREVAVRAESLRDCGGLRGLFV